VRVFVSGLESNSTADGNSSSLPAISDRWDGSQTDIAIIDLDGGKVRRIAHGAFGAWAAFSPDGDRIAFLSQMHDPKATSFQPYFDLVVVSLRTGNKQVVASGVPLAPGYAAWSPDGKWLAYSTSDNKAEGLAVIVSAGGDGIRRTTKGSSVPAQFWYSAPLWDELGRFVYVLGEGALWRVASSDGSATQIAKLPNRTMGTLLAMTDHRRIWSPDGGRSAVVVAQDGVTTQSGFFKVDLTTGSVSTLIEEEKQYGGFGGAFAALKSAASDDGTLVVFAAESSGESEQLWALDTASLRIQQLTQINSHIDSFVMGKEQLIHWTGRDGKPQKGLLLLPSGYQKGRRYPLLVFVYEQSMPYANSFGGWGDFFNLQLFATRGYAVFYPDASIFQKPEPMQRIADIVIPGIKEVADQGIADSGNVGVFGHSSGGYMALSLIVQYPFKAAVVSSGVADMFSFYGIPLENDGSTEGVPWSETQMAMNGTPWEFEDRYLHNSPWFSLDKVTASVLLLAGTEDHASEAQMDQTFVGLRRLGKTVEYAKYEGEGHAEDWWSAANKLDAAQRVIGWFDEFLKNPSTPAEPTRKRLDPK
jgi:dipeptidyl aminopeptidase/acylaminoacyl peptidase